MEVIVIESNAFHRLRDEMIAACLDFTKEWLAKQQSVSLDEKWLNPNEVKKITGLKSRKSLQKLRSSGVHYVKIGRQYMYDKTSLLNYISKKATLKYTLDN